MNNRHPRKQPGGARLLLQLPILALSAASLVGCASSGSLNTGFAGNLASARDTSYVRQADYMQLGARTTPPTGFLDFCIRRPAECDLRIAEQSAATPVETQSLVQKVVYRKYLWSVAFQRNQGGVQTSSLSRAADADVNWRASGQRQNAAESAQDDIVMASSTVDTPLADGADAAPSAEDAAIDAVVRAQDATVQEIRRAPVQIALTDDAKGELNMVNRMINSMIIETTDQANYGVDDYWTEPLEDGKAGPKRGDCEDYVLEKRKAPITAGVPESALSIAVVTTRRGELHAVLLVATNQGELVLDSLSPWVTAWRDTPYKWVERQAPGEPMIWVRAIG